MVEHMNMVVVYPTPNWLAGPTGKLVSQCPPVVLTPILLPAGACRGREVSTDVWYESWRNDLAEKCRRAEKVMNYIQIHTA